MVGNNNKALWQTRTRSFFRFQQVGRNGESPTSDRKICRRFLQVGRSGESPISGSKTRRRVETIYKRPWLFLFFLQKLSGSRFRQPVFGSTGRIHPGIFRLDSSTVLTPSGPFLSPVPGYSG